MPEMTLAPWLEPAANPTRAAIVRQALLGIGIVEEPLGSNRSPAIDEMMHFVGSPVGEPWCAAYACWVLACAGVPDAKNPKTGATKGIQQWAMYHGVWRPMPAEPVPGDIVLYDFSADTLADHAGIVARVRPEGFWAVEGNTTTIPNDREGDGVYYKERLSKYGYTTVLGFVTTVA